MGDLLRSSHITPLKNNSKKKVKIDDTFGLLETVLG